MKKIALSRLLPLVLLLPVAMMSCARRADDARMEIAILAGEKWWGGAVLDGRRSPLNDAPFAYDQYADCRANQAAPLFISSRGRYIWSESPLKIEMTGEKIILDNTRGQIFVGSGGGTLREAFLSASGQFFPPSGKIPDPLLFTSPQYNTWIELQYDQNENDILRYAEDILRHGFPAGVIMIDDNWQERYGTWRFDCRKFADPKRMIGRLQSMGFRVMLWVVPFISSDSPVYRELAARGLLIFADPEKTRPASISWWNGMSALIDLSNPAGEQWFRDQLAHLAREYGVDGFKLDAGDPEFYRGAYSSQAFDPNRHCEAYARIALDFPLNELRACWKLAGHPLAQRLRDKSHTWDDLRVLIPDMIGLGLIGHQFGCPDMIGGGEWTSFQGSSVLDQELIVRSSQVSALMPMMQFSVAPWRVLDKGNLAVCQSMADLHYRMGHEILELAKEAASSGEPMVRSLEYEYPGRGYAGIKDQFLLGGKIMSAPVVHKGQRAREVVFPEGRWQAGDGAVYTGPATVKIDAPLSRLPWFRKIAPGSAD